MCSYILGEVWKSIQKQVAPFGKYPLKNLSIRVGFGHNIDFLCNVLPTKLWNTTAIPVKLHFFTSQTAVL